MTSVERDWVSYCTSVFGVTSNFRLHLQSHARFLWCNPAGQFGG